MFLSRPITFLMLIQQIRGLNLTKAMMDNYPILMNTPNVYLNLICFGLLVACIIRQVLIKYNMQMNYMVLFLSLMIPFGMLGNHFEMFLVMFRIVHLSPFEIMYIYLPVTIFFNSFCLDIHLFLKALPQTLVIAIPAALITACVFGLTMRLIIDPTWPVIFGIVFGLICTPTYPSTIVYLMKELSTRTRHINVLLEAEGIVSKIVAYILQYIIMKYFNGTYTRWYQSVTQLLEFLAIGAVVGYVLGYCGQFLMRQMATDRLNIIVITIGMPLFAFAFSEIFFLGGGLLAVFVIGLMMNVERTSLSKDVDKSLTNIWKAIGTSADIILCMLCSLIASIHVIPHIGAEEYILILVTYLTYYLLRFVTFLIFSPILSRIGYGMNFKNMIVCVWGGIKTAFSLQLVSLLVVEKFPKDTAIYFFFHVIGLYFLSILLNGSFMRSVLDFLGLTKISMARQINMNNCMKHIFLKREKTITILKMDRFLTDTNWVAVLESTNIRHPYKIDLEEDADDFFMGYRFSYCPDCKKEVAQEPTVKEMKEMTREAKTRILKAKKMSYSRQYENGIMSKEGIRVLSNAVEIAMDTNDARIKLESLQSKFEKESWWSQFIRKKVLDFTKNKYLHLKPPRTYWRRICYHIVQSPAFKKTMLAMIAISVVFVIVDMYFHPTLLHNGERDSHSTLLNDIILSSDIFFATIFTVEFVFKILAYSRIHICADGFRTYFKSVWNTVDFFALIAILIETLYHSLQLVFQYHNLKDGLPIYLRKAVAVIRLIRIIRLLRYMELIYPSLIKYLDSLVDRKMAFTYELGKSYAAGETEVLEMLPYMIDNKKINDEIREQIEADRVIVTKLLGVVQKEKPWIAITVKTKQAIRTILCSMRESINNLKTAGWVDQYEFEKLMGSMSELYKRVNSITSVQPSAPKVIFKEVAWMTDEEAIIDFLFENVSVKKYEPGDVVFGPGNVADGIYIVVTGLFMISYTPDKLILDNLQELGRLPIVDYVASTLYEEPFVDYIVSGNCIGELSTLTERPYNCTITADTHSQVYVLSHGVMKRAMELNPDPVIGLECRIWKDVSIRIAASILLKVPTYQTYSQDQIKYVLERSFVPNLSNYKIFTVTEIIQDTLLIDGIVSDFNTRENYVAPCCIPRTAQRLILPTSSLLRMPSDVITKLLIIPDKEADEYDVMILAEETCEMVPTGSATNFLQYAVERRHIKNRRRKLRSLRTDSAQSRQTGITGNSSTSQTDTTPSTYTKGEDLSLYMGELDEEEKDTVIYQSSSKDFMNQNQKSSSSVLKSDSRKPPQSKY